MNRLNLKSDINVWKSFRVVTVLICISIGLTGCLEKTDGNHTKKNVLIITMDTTRPDHLHCYGNEHIRTPVLDNLAAGGVLFEEAYSVQPVTLPAHCSIMTGLYPYQHGVRDNSTYFLKPEFTTIAERLKQNGYFTAAFVSAFVLHRRFGLNQGFDFYNDTFIKPKQKGRLPVDRRASEVSFLAGEWLRINHDALTESPFFLWLHYYDPHADYDAPEPYRSAYPDKYDGEIAYMDDWIGYVIDSLKLENLYKNTVIVIVGDHGEGLGEHGENTHGMFIYQPTIHIPLIMHNPEIIPAGKRINEPVCSIDIAPTIMNALGLDISKDDFSGVSLMEHLESDDPLPERNLYRETYIPKNFSWSPLAGLQGNDRLYIQAPRPELLTLFNDGSTGKDMINTEFDIAGLYQDHLNQLTGSGDGLHSYLEIDADSASKLESLGYFVQPDSTQNHTKDTPSLPDPKDRIEFFNLYQKALQLHEKNYTEDASELMKKLVEEDPDNMRFKKDYATMVKESGDIELARTIFESIVSNHPDDLEAHLDLGGCFENLGQSEDALREYNAALAVNSNNYLARFHLGMIYLKTGQWERSENQFLLCRQTNQRDPACLNNLAYISIKHRNDPEQGFQYLNQALELEPENPELLLSIGNACRNVKRLDEAVAHLEKALEISPDSLPIINELLTCYKEQNNQKAMRRLLNRKSLLE